MESLAEFTVGRLSSVLTEWGYRPSHAARVLRSYYATGGAPDWDRLKLPEGFRDRLECTHPPFSSLVTARQVAEDGTTKLLLRFPDGKAVETVMMTDYRQDRVAGCLSTQAGCAMGCDFCATAQGGLERNLSAGEIVEQFLRLRREALSLGRVLHTLVFMGMGEPMHNYENVIEAVRRIGGEALGAMGWRRITISTVGIIPGMKALSEEGLRVSLAVSLHAPDDETRARLLPAGKRYRIEDILAAADHHQAATGLPVIIQYCLLRGVNDSPAQAEALASLLGRRRMHVNLLHYNPTGPGLSGFNYEACPPAERDRFIEILRKHGVIAHFRRPRGREISAACGQLRAEEA